MKTNKDIIGEFKIEIKTGLSVDTQTFNVCLNLINIYAKNNNVKGMVLRFDDELEKPGLKMLMTERDVVDAMYGKVQNGGRR